MSDYLQTFMDETDEQLDDLVEVLLVLEREPESSDELNEAFRLIHSIKGAAGMMGFDNIAALTHHLESRFELLRSGLASLDESTMNLVLRCIDFLRDCIARLRASEPLGSAGELMEEVMALGAAAEQRPAEPVDVVEADEPLEAGVGVVEELPDVLGGYRLTVHFEAGLLLADLKARLILSRLEELGDIISTRPDSTALDTIESLTELHVALKSEESAAAIRSAANLDGVESVDLVGGSSVDVVSTSAATESGPPVEPASSSEAPSITAPEPGVEPVVESKREPVATTDESRAGGERTRSKGTETMRVDIDRLDSLLNLAGELVVNRARFVQVAREVRPAFREQNVVVRARELGASLRNTVERLERFASADVDLKRDIEELKAGVDIIEEQSELWDHGRRGFEQLNEAIEQLVRISDSVQQSVLDTRMVPVAPLFNRFKRVVRDLSAEKGKRVDLVIHGEKTELDKRMIDELGEPLVHLVRNAVDHGLEPPDVRLGAGKLEAGTITLLASQRGNNVFISIRDDGRGIDVARIKERLADRGLLSSSAIDELSDEQALDYIWHPGFSTAAELSDTSGRGVGMDAVRTRITELSGTIEVESRPEEGTTFTIRLPLTLAIISSLLVRVHNVIFSIPIEDVREIVSVRAADVVTVRNRQAIEVRDEFIPLIQITDVFDWNQVTDTGAAPARPGGLSSTVRPGGLSSTVRPGGLNSTVRPGGLNSTDLVDAVILHTGGRTMTLRVDELLGSQDIVIKSLSENFVQIHGLSGASLLGDGSVCLMLDVGAVMNLAASSKEKVAELDPR